MKILFLLLLTAFNIHSTEIFPKLNLKAITPDPKELKSYIVLVAYGDEWILYQISW